MQIKPIFKNSPYFTIVFAFNDNYSKYFAVALKSLIENANNRFLYDIVVFTSNISQNNIMLLNKMIPENFSLRFFNLKEIISKDFPDIILSSFQDWSVEMYYRIFIPLIMQNYDKVLYLDTDTIILDDLQQLFSIDFQGKSLLAVSDTIPYRLQLDDCSKQEQQMLANLQLSDISKYFNSGMLLFNIKAINLAQYLTMFKMCLDKENLLFPDQDILNVLFENYVKFIPTEWNYCTGELIFNPNFINIISGDYKKEYLQAKAKPKIIHYTCSLKPWNEKMYEHFGKFWHYARKTPFYEEILHQMSLDIAQKNFIKSTKFTNLYLQIKAKRKVVLWGASLFLEEFIKQYDIDDDNIIGIVDKNPSKKGTFIRDYKIYAPEDLKNLNPEEIIITIVNSTKKRTEEIKSYLNSKGLSYITVKTL